MIEQLPAAALQSWLEDEGRDAPLVVDVRERWEHTVCSIAGSQLIPMQEIPGRADELPKDRPIVVLCHHGMRSLQVAQYLEGAGFSRLSVLGPSSDW